MTDSFEQIGADLNSARLERGIQINELSQLLRISKTYLKDIEAGDFDALPGPTYVAGYLRSFAREVGLDPVAVPQRYRALRGQGESVPAYSFPVDHKRPQRSGAMMASIVVIFAVAGYGGWYALGKPDILTSLTGEGQTETVALPQVESTVTEPDDMSSRDDAPVDLATAREPAIAGSGDAPETVDAPVTNMAATMTETVTGATPIATGTAAAEPVETPAAEVVVPPVFEAAPDTDLAAGPAAETVNPAAPPSGTSENAAPVTGMLADSTTPAAPQASADVETVADLAAADSAGTGPVTVSPTADALADDRLATVATARNDTSDSMNSQIGAGVAFARQRVPDMEITVRATGVSWIEVIRNDGEEVMTKLMRAGDTYMVDSRDRLYLSTGNAGGLELVFNDGTTRSIGDSGEILRDLLLDATKLRNQF